MTEDNFIIIDSQATMDLLISRLNNGYLMAEKFRFADDSYYLQLFSFLGIDLDEYRDKGYYYDENRNLHIAESEFEYTWISNMGLVSSGKATADSYLNACLSQYIVISILFDKALNICKDEAIYNVDGYYFGYLRDLTPALFHNVLFYIEVFGKAYLSLSNSIVPFTHDLDILYKGVLDTIQIKKHNDTLFHADVIMEFLRTIEYIKTIPGNFKEHFVKYDANIEDNTLIRFDFVSLSGFYDSINCSLDFINNYDHDGDNSMYLKPGLLDRRLAMAITDEDKRRLMDRYGCLT